jgi:hypothetical protein
MSGEEPLGIKSLRSFKDLANRLEIHLVSLTERA